MKIYTIETGNFKLDGGAMFGIVPKSIWNKTNPADDRNLIDLTMRCLLIEDGKRLILIDTGIGTKQDAKFFGFYYLWGDATLDNSLAKHGFHRDDITDVFLTHLHFDHCGGNASIPNARLIIQKREWIAAKSEENIEKQLYTVTYDENNIGKFVKID